MGGLGAEDVNDLAEPAGNEKLARGIGNHL